MNKKIKIMLAQLNPTVGDLEKNSKIVNKNKKVNLNNNNWLINCINVYLFKKFYILYN